MSQHDFNSKVYNLLETVVERINPSGYRSEPKHGIVGDPMYDKLWEVLMAKPEDLGP